MVVEKYAENEEDLENEEIPEKQMKLKRRKLSERLQDPIRVKLKHLLLRKKCHECRERLEHSLTL